METLLRTNHIATSHGTHSHDHPQILIGHQGVMQCDLPSSGGKITRGSIAILPSSVEHRYRGGSEQCRLLVIDLNPQDLFLKALEDVCRISLEEQLLDRPELLRPTLSILSFLDWADTQLPHTALHNMPAFQYQLISVFLTQLMMRGSQPSSTAMLPQRVDQQRLDTYIDKHLHRSIDNDELANLLHVSTSHLYVLVRRQSGLSPQQYVAKRRMMKAQVLLNERKMSITQVAEMVGFSDGASFTHAYRRRFGDSPSKIRE